LGRLMNLTLWVWGRCRLPSARVRLPLGMNLHSGLSGLPRYHNLTVE
jgi:hypothetical protein